MKKLISIVIPVFNEEGNITELVKRLNLSLNKEFDYEILFIDDGSTDRTIELIEKYRNDNKSIKYISFSRNFGHQNAIRAGLKHSKGSAVITIDADLQHPPELITELLKSWEKGCDIVNTKRKDNLNTNVFKKITAKIFYNLLNKISDIKIESGSADFRLLDRKIVDILNEINESNIFFRGMISWLGFKQCYIEYNPDKRFWGSSRYSLKKMLKLGVSGITSFSVAPLHISTTIGYIFAFCAFIYALFAIYTKLFTNNTLSGWTSVLTAILLIGGLQLIMIGIVGEYIGRIFLESKRRPNYIIKSKQL